MNLPTINTNTLRELLKLSEKKEGLLKELKKVELQMATFLKDYPLSEIQTLQQTTFKGRDGYHFPNYTASRKRAPRGAMQKQIFEVLAAAGPVGIKIPELAKKIGSKSANVHVWFSSAGKKFPQIERIGAGTFRLRQSKLAEIKKS